MQEYVRRTLQQVVGSSNLPINNHTRPTISAATNRFNNGQGYLYDKAGNVIKDPENRTYTFNGDNKQTQVKNSSNQVIGTYFYDGDGKRIKKVTATETTTFVYSGGKKVAEYSSKVPMPYPTTKYVATDTLGSIRAITNQFGQVLSRRDFMPFGEELYAGTPNRSTSQKYAVGDDNVREKFTGYERDVETGLDFAEARYYKNNHGRFTAVDPLLASGKSANPQTFNRYAYVGSSPLRFIDPSGMQASETVNTIYSKARKAYVDFVTYWFDTRGSTPYSRSTFSPSGKRKTVTRFEKGYISTRFEQAVYEAQLRQVGLDDAREGPRRAFPGGPNVDQWLLKTNEAANFAKDTSPVGAVDNLMKATVDFENGKIGAGGLTLAGGAVVLEFGGNGAGGGAKKGFNLAAGLGDNLFDFARKTNSTTYFEKVGTTLFVPEKFTPLADEANVINFNLRNFSFSKHVDWLKRGKPDEPGRATSFELEHILNDEELLNKTRFYVHPELKKVKQ